MGQDQPHENEPNLQLPDDMKAFSSQLESFSARSVSVNRDRLMFEAGQAAARCELSSRSIATRRTIRMWQSAALVLAAVSMGLGTTLVSRPEPAGRFVAIDLPQPGGQSHDTGEHESESQSTSANGLQATLPVQRNPEIETRNDSISERPIVTSTRLDELRSRQSVIDQLIESSSRPGGGASKVQVNSTFAAATPHPILSSRLLMAGEKSRIWINNLIEEPSL